MLRFASSEALSRNTPGRVDNASVRKTNPLILRGSHSNDEIRMSSNDFLGGKNNSALSYLRSRIKPKFEYYVVCQYAPHGYSIGAEQWSKEIHVPQTIEGAFAQGAQEVIVVLPDPKTVHNGSMYSSSITTGDFEQFIAKDVVAYIDAHYRTIANRASRGLARHSMGGYGATRIGMRHADVLAASTS